MKEGQTLGVVGESGSGKTTLGLALLRLVSSDGPIIYLGDRIGNYFTLALAAFTGLVGMLFALRGFQKNLQLLKAKIKEGIFPLEEFITLTGIFAAGILLLTPGFITDIVGFLLFVPVIRSALGRLIIRLSRTNFKELYEYMKLYDY